MTCRPSIIAALLASFVLTLNPAAADEPILPQTHPVELDPENQTIGELSYRGGLDIEPGEAEIGRISGLEWWDSELYAVTEDGRWLIMLPDGFRDQLTDVIEVEHGPLLDQKGKKLRRKDDQQARAIRRDASGQLLVAFANGGHVWRYSGLDQPAEQTEIAADSITPLDRSIALTIPPGSQEQAVDCASNGVCFLLFASEAQGESRSTTIIAVSPDGNQETLASWEAGRIESLTVREEGGSTYLYLASNSDPSASERTRLMKYEISHRAATQPGVPEKVYATEQVVIETSMGEITISLETERAPITAANFLRYVDEGRYDGTKCYRAMRHKQLDWPSGFLQCGTQNHPDRILPGIVHEPTNETGLSHTNGALSMARFAPGTATGDFSIMIENQVGLDAQPDASDPELRPGFAVFGYVTSGMEVVHAIHGTPVDPEAGEGFLKGQMLAEPVRIISMRRAEPPE